MPGGCCEVVVSPVVMDRAIGPGGAGLCDGYATPVAGSVKPRYPVPGADRTVPLGVGLCPFWVGRDDDTGLVFDRIVERLGNEGTGGTGGAGDPWRSRGL